ncbi:MAG: prefoldin subunit alpha [Nanobdellota archaeon]
MQTKDNSLNEKYIELEMVKQRLDELNKALDQIENHIEHSQVAMTTLKEISSNKDSEKESKELLIPLGSQTFLKVSAENVASVHQAVGAGVVVEKKTQEAIDNLKTNIGELQEQKKQYTQVYEQVIAKSEELQKSIESQFGSSKH